MKPGGPTPTEHDEHGDPAPLPHTPTVRPETPREKPARAAPEPAPGLKIHQLDAETFFPRALIDFAVEARRDGFVRTGNDGAAANIMKRRVKARWSAEKSEHGWIFKERVHPLDAYLRPGNAHERAHAPPRGIKPYAVPNAASAAVVEARKRWNDAKATGDADAMTRAANDLLRAVEADRAARGEHAVTPEDGRRHPIDAFLAPTGADAQHLTPKGKGEDGPSGAAGVRAADISRQEVKDNASGSESVLESGDAIRPRLGGISDNNLMRIASGIAHANPDQRDALLPEAKQLEAHTGAAVEDTTPSFSDDSNEAAEFEGDSTDRTVELISARDRGLRPRDTSEDSPRDFHPDHPNAGMDRVKRARRRGHRFGPTAGQRHWIDPEADWDVDTVNEVIRESGGQPVTPELLMILSNEAYPDNRSEPPRDRAKKWRKPRPGQPGRSQGWEFLTDEKGDSYYGMAVYDPDTNTLVIVNRGVNFLSGADRTAAYAVINGGESPQIVRAQRLLYNAWRAAVARARELGRPPPRLIVTGHSLGGAMAQIQMATVYSDQRTFAGVDVTGATFATLGARGVVDRLLRDRWRHVDRRALDGFMKQRMVNYYREGDGMILDRLGLDRMPGRFGLDVEMAGIEMGDLDDEEDMLTDLLATDPNFRGSLEDWRRRNNLRDRWFKNHSLLSYFHPDFTDPLDRVLERRGRSRR